MRIERSRRRVVIGGGPPSVRQMEILRSGQGRRVGVRSAEGGGGGDRVEEYGGKPRHTSTHNSLSVVPTIDFPEAVLAIIRW